MILTSNPQQKASIIVNVPRDFALDKTWEMHFEENDFTSRTYSLQQDNGSCQRQVTLKSGKSVRQTVKIDRARHSILYENVKGYVSGSMQMKFEAHGGNLLNKTIIKVESHSKTEDNEPFPPQQQLQDGLKEAKKILQARFKVESDIAPKCCECSLFG